MATATRKSSTRKSAVKVTTPRRRPAATTTAAPKAAAKKRTTKKVEPELKSVTGTFIRGKRDRTTREIMPHEPTAGGGVRFEEASDNGKSPVYLTQDDDKALGNPAKIRVTVARIA